MGLGNPGPRYVATRHNVGFEIVRAFALRHGIAIGSARFEGEYGAGRVGAHEVGLLLPRTFMNGSGAAVAAALAGLPRVDPGEGLLIVYDDLDLAPGRIRLRAGGGAGGHRGVASILEAVGTTGIPRLRFGIGRPPVGGDPREYVLEPLDEAGHASLVQRIARAVDAIDDFLAEGVEAAMDRHNAAPPDGSPA